MCVLMGMLLRQSFTVAPFQGP
uniref:Uncharacterized protein n=1 Tax=Arundo donax TaxID=35708 RepID=A0A0A9AHV9_ARUDO